MFKGAEDRTQGHGCVVRQEAKCFLRAQHRLHVQKNQRALLCTDTPPEINAQRNLTSRTRWLVRLQYYAGGEPRKREVLWHFRRGGACQQAHMNRSLMSTSTPALSHGRHLFEARIPSYAGAILHDPYLPTL